MNFYGFTSPWYQDAEFLYSHLLDLRDLPCQQIIQRLRQLFIEGTQYPEAEVLETIHRLAASSHADREFIYVLNRCCYILINHWWSRADLRYTAALVELFQQTPTTLSRSPAVDRLRAFVPQFVQTEQYRALLDRVNIANAAEAPQEVSEPPSVQDALYRYPFLYHHLLLGEDTSEMGREEVLRLQRERQQRYDQRLTHYLRSELSFAEGIKPLTGFEEPQLRRAIRQYAGKSTHSATYQEATQQFFSRWDASPAQTQAVTQLSHYLGTSVDQFAQQSSNEHYGQFFSHWLQSQLRSIASPKAFLGRSDLLLTEVCWQLLDTLLAHPGLHREHHGKFLDLHGNLGATFAVGVILKIALLCRRNWQRTCDRIAKHLAALVQHYRQSFQTDLKWLLEILDHWMLASVLHTDQPEFRAGRIAVAYAYRL